jgi:hypothetical protein
MIAKDLLRALRQHRGRIYVEVSNMHDMVIVEAVKSDLINLVSGSFQIDEETGFSLMKDTFGRDYNDR